MTFEQGHGQAYRDLYSGRNSYVEGQIDARRLFGTPEQNHYSILAAIRHNPTAYVRRVPRLAKFAAEDSLDIYGGPLLGSWFFLMAIGGCIELVRKKQFLLLCILLFWPSYLLLHILLVFQSTHFLFPFPIIFCLASIVVASFVAGTTGCGAIERCLWSALLLGFIGIGIVQNQPSLLKWWVIVFLIIVWILWILVHRNRIPEVIMALAFVFLCSVTLAAREGYHSPRIRKLGTTPEEKAALFLHSRLRHGSAVAAYAPILPWTAGMNYVGMYKSVLPDMQSAYDLNRWMENNKLQAIYADHDLREFEPFIWRLVEIQIGKNLKVAFTSDDGNTQILLIN
jgi:hypothetical protein